ncbi:MAG TPA: hydrolase [Magnetospirillaceae bacterium]|jgi:nicotinamidase-related amidase
MEKIDPQTTALVVIDLQKGIMRMPVAPHAAADVLTRTLSLVERFRTAKAPVALVNVGWSADFGDALKQPVDAAPASAHGGMPADFKDLAPELGPAPTDILITKRQWNAFYGTELDLQLRRRGIKTIVMTGIATHIGVEGTARAGWEMGYAFIFAEDAMSSMTAEAHKFSTTVVLPRLGRIRPTAEILAALG